MTHHSFDDELLEKRGELRAQGLNPYPYSFSRTHTLAEVRQRQAELMGKEVAVAGRLTAHRDAGKLVFADIRDASAQLQLMFRKNDFDDAAWKIVKKTVDLGDHLGARGPVFLTKMGELTVHAAAFEILAKAVVRVPIQKATEEKTWFQLADPEIKYRERYLYWITDPASRLIMEVRARAISAIRRHLEQRGFLEVTTPAIEMIYGGAEARPFATSIHALSDQPAYLRISPELPLKRFIVGGFEKVFTICQNFRNEGIDRSHNPEFTMLEWYEAYTDYHDQMERFQDLVSSVALEITGAMKIRYQGQEIDFTPPWRKLTVLDGLKERGIDAEGMEAAALAAELKKRGLEIPQPLTWGHGVMELFKNLVEPGLLQPTFVCDHPVEISPLTKAKRGNPRVVERFEPMAAGMELGNAYSELTDPVEQLQRLEDQKGLGKDKAGIAHHPIDHDFVKAIGCGMPPTGGVGLGIDRLVMLLADAPSIRDVIAFPLMRPKDE
ncbi:MAG: lysine--tRNA ligase [Planctomycetes bacterium]|nr:lysine--tRNA ligase [Planctomycetota bacterium]